MIDMTTHDAPVAFEAVIVPHRSLGRGGLRVLGGALLLLSGGVAIGLWIAGAWPVIGFTGVEAALAVWLLRRHALGARCVEMLLLTGGELRVVRIGAKGARSERLLPTDWLRACLDDRPGRTPALVLRARGEELEVAAALGEQEKRDLAAALQEALTRQRHPVFDNEQLREASARPESCSDADLVEEPRETEGSTPRPAPST